VRKTREDIEQVLGDYPGGSLTAAAPCIGGAHGGIAFRVFRPLLTEPASRRFLPLRLAGPESPEAGHCRQAGFRDPALSARTDMRR
jgi:hypothetical protein